MVKYIYMEKERRNSRIDESLSVSYRIINSRFAVSMPSKNISADGICLPVFQKLEKGMLLHLNIKLSELASPIEAVGEIIWRTEKKDAKFPFEIGIRFIKIAPADKEKIFEYVKEKCKKEGKSGVSWIG